MSHNRCAAGTHHNLNLTRTSLLQPPPHLLCKCLAPVVTQTGAPGCPGRGATAGRSSRQQTAAALAGRGSQTARPQGRHAGQTPAWSSLQPSKHREDARGCVGVGCGGVHAHKDGRVRVVVNSEAWACLFGCRQVAAVGGSWPSCWCGQLKADFLRNRAHVLDTLQHTSRQSPATHATRTRVVFPRRLVEVPSQQLPLH